MKLVRGAIVDILVTLFIVLATTMDLGWGRVALLVYTALMLLLKVAALSSGGLRRITVQQKRETPPLWLYHLLYALNTIALGFAEWWYLFAGWGVIWILSILIERRA